MRILPTLIIAAALEVGGDALIRAGIKGKAVQLLILGAVMLVSYGILVNLTSLDFGRLMGIYIVLFFLISQITAILIFRERLPLPVLVGGLMVIAGGVTMTCWR